MAAEIFYDDDADLSLIQAKKVAVLGYGSQGHAHALSLRDSGCEVRVGLPEGSKSRPRAEAEGLTVTTPADACAWADVIMVLTPDTTQRGLYSDAIAPNLQSGDALFFAHGFNIHFGYITPPPEVDVAMAASLMPSLMLQRVLMTGQPAGRGYAEQVVGSVLLPVLGLPPRPSATTHPETAHD